MSERTARFLAAMSHDLYPALILGALLFGIASYGCTVGERRLALSTNRSQMKFIVVVHGFARSLCVLNVLAFVISFLHPGCAALMAHRSKCMSNLRALSMATAMYAEDYNDRLPPASHWSDVVEPRVLKAPPGLEGRVERPFDCPSSESKASYGINAALDRLALEKVDQPAASVLLFEADAPFRSYAGGRQDVAAERHNLGSHYAFVDGHVKYYSPQAAMNLNWNAKSIAEGTTAK